MLERCYTSLQKGEEAPLLIFLKKKKDTNCLETIFPFPIE